MSLEKGSLNMGKFSKPNTNLDIFLMNLMLDKFWNNLIKAIVVMHYAGIFFMVKRETSINPI